MTMTSTVTFDAPGGDGLWCVGGGEAPSFCGASLVSVWA